MPRNDALAKEGNGRGRLDAIAAAASGHVPNAFAGASFVLEERDAFAAYAPKSFAPAAAALVPYLSRPPPLSLAYNSFEFADSRQSFARRSKKRKQGGGARNLLVNGPRTSPLLDEADCIKDTIVPCSELNRIGAQTIRGCTLVAKAIFRRDSELALTSSGDDVYSGRRGELNPRAAQIL